MWFLALAYGQTQQDVEEALERAEREPSVETTTHAAQVANSYRRSNPTDLARMLETYAFLLRYPFDNTQISSSLHDGGLSTHAKKNRKHPMAGRAVCAFRDLNLSDGRDVRAEEFEKLSKKLKHPCGSPRDMAKVSPAPAPTETDSDASAVAALEDQLVKALKARQEAATTEGTPETDALEAELAANTAEAQAEALEATRDYADAKAEHDAAKAELANALKNTFTRAGCEDDSPAPAARIEACSLWVDQHPDDAPGLLFLVKAHMELVQAGQDRAEHAARAIAHIEQLKTLVPEEAHGDFDRAIEGLQPLIE